MRKFHLAVAVCALSLSACGGGSDGTLVAAPPAPGGPPTPPAPTAPSVTSTPVFTQLPAFSTPVALLQAPGDSGFWYVVEKNGTVRVFANDENSTASSLFLDITSVVDASGEGGLLGMAFHPSYPAIPEVIISYTRTGSPLTSFISRFTSVDNGLTLNNATEEVLFTVLQNATNHNGGNVVYGPDDNLYIGFGDGGGSGDPAEHGQNTSSLKGTIVRITVNAAAGTGFSIPGDNPFAGNSVCTQGIGAAPCPEIFAWGLRNPWRFSFDSATGKLWAGDVGQNAFEEIDLIELGSNYGWNDREGAHCFDPMSGCATNFVEPITEYGRALGGSVTGGYVYRGSTIPDLVGWYVFGDFSSGRLFAIPEDSTTGVTVSELDQTGLQIVSFGESVDSELYILDIGGTIHQLVAGP